MAIHFRVPTLALKKFQIDNGGDLSVTELDTNAASPDTIGMNFNGGYIVSGKLSDNQPTVQLKEEDSGRICVFNTSSSTNFILPDNVQLGMKFKFITTVAAAGAAVHKISAAAPGVSNASISARIVSIKAAGGSISTQQTTAALTLTDLPGSRFEIIAKTDTEEAGCWLLTGTQVVT